MHWGFGVALAVGGFVLGVIAYPKIPASITDMTDKITGSGATPSATSSAT